jgi:hypothetical protein
MTTQVNMDIDAFIEQLEKLKKAHELLHKIFVEVGPYGNDRMNQSTVFELQRYFNFDDSE